MFPFVHLANGLEVPTFFLVISSELLISLLWVFRRSKHFDLPTQQTLDLSLLLMAASLIGSRLLHVIFENPDYYLADPKKVFYLWDGGFVFFGGAFMAFAAAMVFFKVKHIQERGVYFDMFAPVLAFSYGIGRLGCFFAGCCYGERCDLPWAVAGRHPTQLYALFWELGVMMILLGVENIEASRRPALLQRSGDIFLLWVALHSAGRLLMESFRDDFRGESILGVSISSFFCLVLILTVTLLFARKKQQHGNTSTPRR